jgi:Pentapeptide repeats (8 copies)
VSLFEEAATFLEAEGWSVGRYAKGAGSIVGTRAGLGDTIDSYTVWCPEAATPDELRRGEATLLRRFAEDAGDRGEKVLLVETLLGLSNGFKADAKDQDIKIRVPIQFFDANFRWETQDHPTAASQMNKNGAQRSQVRTPQPYRNLDNGAVGDDLLDELVARFEDPVDWDRPLVFVTAPAGYGKSILFESLYSALFQRFKTSKLRQVRARRPLPLLPEYVASATTPNLRGLVESFLQSDIARPIKLPTFEWMLTRGHASWLMDGLDEVISQDANFFQYMWDLLETPGGSYPRVLICVRDSLISSSESLREFMSEASPFVSQFRLLPWEAPSVKTFAQIRLGPQADQFTSVVQARPRLLELCGTPYYAELLATRLEKEMLNDELDDLSEVQLVNDAIEKIIDREYTKSLLHASVIPAENVLLIVRDVAMMELTNGARGVAVVDIIESANILLPEDLSPADREQISTQMCQLSVFESAAEHARVKFAQDVIFEFLIGQQAVAHFKASPHKFVPTLNWRVFPHDSITLRVLRNEIAAGARDDLQAHLAQAAQTEFAFKNVLQIVLGLPDATRIIRQAPLERQDLSGLTFADLSLAGVSLRGTTLESTRFLRCDLTGCDLSEATLHDTRFDECGLTLARAVFGELDGFVSASIDIGGLIDSVEAFAKRVSRGSRGSIIGPCPSAKQLQHLLRKFVGIGNRRGRVWMDRNGIVAGVRYVDPMLVLNAAVHAGFLSAATGRPRYDRTRDSILYPEMVGFARSLTLTDTTRTLLDGICATPGCPHVRTL